MKLSGLNKRMQTAHACGAWPQACTQRGAPLQGLGPQASQWPPRPQGVWSECPHVPCAYKVSGGPSRSLGKKARGRGPGAMQGTFRLSPLLPAAPCEQDSRGEAWFPCTGQTQAVPQPHERDRGGCLSEPWEPQPSSNPADRTCLSPGTPPPSPPASLKTVLV